MSRIVFLLALLSGALGYISLEGECNYASIGGFETELNISRMFGTWNQIARIDTEALEGDCSSLNVVGKYENEELASVQASFIDVLNKTKIYHNGTFGFVPSVAGLLYMNITGYPESFVVQSTNYSDYAILYSCITLNLENITANVTAQKLVMGWQYHRKAELTTAEQASLTSIVNNNPDFVGLNWTSVSHSDKACGRNAAVSLNIPYVLIFLATMFLGKEFVFITSK